MDGRLGVELAKPSGMPQGGLWYLGRAYFIRALRKGLKKAHLLLVVPSL